MEISSYHRTQTKKQFETEKMRRQIIFNFGKLIAFKNKFQVSKQIQTNHCFDTILKKKKYCNKVIFLTLKNINMLIQNNLLVLFLKTKGSTQGII